jgi:threonine dehydrogenase-like Zn-dependent dehydrogenase
MKQLTQKLKDGKMEVLEVPAPTLSDGMVTVRNHYSLISAGTEGSTVSAARKSLIGKAKERPQQVKQAVNLLKQQGPVQTYRQAYRTVMKKLDAYSPLGYSSAGEIIEVAPDVKCFSVGDLVACGGGSASHAEIIAVPQNLCVKIPITRQDEQDIQDKKEILKRAAYNTLGAIALQGVRRADVRIGEHVAVIGMGLIGQITAQILNAAGCRVIGIDLVQDRLDMAKENGINHGYDQEKRHGCCGRRRWSRP